MRSLIFVVRLNGNDCLKTYLFCKSNNLNHLEVDVGGVRFFLYEKL